MTEAPVIPTEPVEPPKEKHARHARRGRLYLSALLAVCVVAVLIVLAAANAHTVKVDWVLGSGRVSLVWVILAAVVGGWLCGITTSVLVRHRTHRPT